MYATTAQRRSPMAAVRLVVLLALEVGFVVALHRLGALRVMAIDTGDFRGWLESTPTANAVVAVVRVVGLAAAYWLLASTVVYLLAAATRIPAFMRAAGWWTLPFARRIVDGVLVATIVGTAVFATPIRAMAQTPSSAPAAVAFVPTPAGDPLAPVTTTAASTTAAPTTAAPSTTGAVSTTAATGVGASGGAFVPTPAGDPANPAPTTTIAPTSTATPTTANPAPTTTAPTTAPVAPPTQVLGEQVTKNTSYTVVRGDNFWVIAQRHLTQELGRKPTVDEVRVYWLKVIDVNRASISSGNPNLIFPGEVFELPAV